MAIKSIIVNIFLIIIIAFFSCEKSMPIDCINPPCDVDTSKMTMIKDTNIIWQIAPIEDSSSSGSIIPVVFSENILFTRRPDANSDGFYIYNKLTGKLEWSYIDPVSLNWKSGARHLYKNYCVVGGWSEFYIFDLEHNILIKKINLKDLGYEGQPRIGGIGEYLFIPVEIIGDPKKNFSNTWLQYNMLSGEFKEILTIEDKGTFEAGFESLAFWNKPNGDTVMIFQNRQYDFKNADRRIDMYAYNLTQKKYEWRIDSFTRTGQTSVFPIIVKGDRFFFQGSNEAFCFSCVDGHQIWNRYFPGEGFFRTNAVLAEGKYIMKGESDKMYALDENNGATVWENPNAGHSNTNMIYHNGRVFYETGQDGWGVLRGLRVSNGQVEWTYNSSNRFKYSNASFGLSGIAIDPETNYIYSNDRIFHMCIKLPN